MLLDMEPVQGFAPGVDQVRAMRETPVGFYLTGSRFMGCARQDSDWDFMVEDSESNREFLKNLGFEVMGKEQPCDYTSEGSPTRAVYQLLVEDFCIQVQLSRRVDIRRKCRDIIREHLAEQHKDATKDERIRIWNGLYELLTITPSAWDLVTI